MRVKALAAAILVALVSVARSEHPVAAALGKPGITPLPCATLAWEKVDPKFDALPGAHAHFGEYEGGLYRI